MLESGRSPEHVDTYDPVLNVKGLTKTEKELIPTSKSDTIMLDKAPDGLRYGKNYDFTVIHAGSEKYILSPKEFKKNNQ